MSRIRSIKPEFWTSEQILECSANARLLFIGLWNFCDDLGRHPYSARQAKAEVFPADNITENAIYGMLRELETNNLITRYESGNKEYFFVNGWRHQRIDKPQAAKYPDPFADNSQIIPGTLPPDTIGEDRKGKDTIRSVVKATRPDPDFQEFKEAYPKRGASNPWQPASKLFDQIINDGHNPGEIIAAAKLYAAECDKNKITGTDKVAQAQTWLRQARFLDYAPTGPAMRMLAPHSPEWEAERLAKDNRGEDTRFMESQADKGHSWPASIPREAAE